MKKAYLLPIFIVLFGGGLFFIFRSGANHDEDLSQGEAVNVSETTNTEDVQGISPTVKYNIEFVALWSNETHPDYYDSNAHFSPLVAYTHKEGGEIFKTGGKSSPGMEQMAETGATDTLAVELQSFVDMNLAQESVVGERIDSPGSISVTLSTSLDNPYLTFVSMVAPSPDWFVGVEAINLVQDGDWVDDLELNLVTYDAGTDSGTELTSSDLNTSPKENVIQFDDYLQNLGVLKISRIDK